jgi:hypothetical protein
MSAKAIIYIMLILVIVASIVGIVYLVKCDWAPTTKNLSIVLLGFVIVACLVGIGLVYRSSGGNPGPRLSQVVPIY